MLIRLFEYDYDNYEEDPYKNPKFIKGYREDNFDQLLIMLTHMKDQTIQLDKEQYVFNEFIFNFPKDEDYIPSIDIYVTEKY